MPGLDHSSFGSLMPRAAKSIELLRQRKASGELPLLSLPARRDDINAWQPIIDRYRSQFDDVVVLGIGGSSLGGATLCRLADSGIGAVNGSPRVRFLDHIDPWTFEELVGRLDLARTGSLSITQTRGPAETNPQTPTDSERDVTGK